MTIENDTGVVSGGSDGKLITWDRDMNKLETIDLSNLHNSSSGPSISATRRVEVRALDFDDENKTFLVGTRGAEVLEVSARGEGLAKLVSGHFAATNKSELWGAACHPKDQFFATCGADRVIRIWTAK